MIVFVSCLSISVAGYSVVSPSVCCHVRELCYALLDVIVCVHEDYAQVLVCWFNCHSLSFLFEVGESCLLLSSEVVHSSFANCW